MGRKALKLNITLGLKEAATLATHLAGLIGKGSISTTPFWAKSIVAKIGKAAREQFPDELLPLNKSERKELANELGRTKLFETLPSSK